MAVVVSPNVDAQQSKCVMPLRCNCLLCTSTYSPVEVSALLLFLATNLSVLFAIEMLFSLQVQASNHKDWHIFAAYGALFLCSIFSVWLYHFMTQTVQKENAAQIALKQAQLTKEHQQALQDMYSDMLRCV